MADAPSPALAEWVARAVHPAGRVVRRAALVGGITAAMDRLTVRTPAGEVDVVLRRWPDAAWADGLVEREIDGLAAVAGADVVAPRLIAADPDGSAAGIRCTVTNALDGVPDLAPTDLAAFLAQLARVQAAIHRAPALPATRWDGWYDEGADADGRRPLRWIADPGLRVAAQDAAALLHEPQRVLVHGDYQPFNVLWQGSRLTGVVDWPNAAAGLRGGDVGHLRLNLATLFGAPAAAAYLPAYERAAGVPVDRVADLRALLCFDRRWEETLPVQVAGRASVDTAGMAARVTETVRAAVDAIG